MAYSLIRSRRRWSHAHNHIVDEHGYRKGHHSFIVFLICGYINHQSLKPSLSVYIPIIGRVLLGYVSIYLVWAHIYLWLEISFITLPLGRIPRYTHVSLKTPSKNPVGEKDRRKEYIVHASYIALVASLKTLCEKHSSKNSLREKEYNTRSSWSHNLQDWLFFVNS